MKYFSLLILVLFCSSCSKYYSTGPAEKALIKDIYLSDSIIVLDFDEAVPLNSIFVKNIKKRDFWRSAELSRSIKNCVREAKKSNADIVKLMSFQQQSTWDSGNIEAKLYKKDSSKSNTLEYEHTNEEEEVISRLQGQRKGEYEFFNGDGYNITVFQSNKNYNSKTIKSLKKKFEIENKTKEQKSEFIETEHVLFKTVSQIVPGLPSFNDVYMVPDNEGGTKVIRIESSLPRNQAFETSFLKLYLHSRIPSHNYERQEIDSIFFVNRFIELGPLCQWRGTKNVQCPYKGQLDWEIFSSKDRAQEFIRQRIGITAGKNGVEVLSQQELDVIFEGNELTAQKYIFHLSIPSVFLDGSNTLYAYYIISEIDSSFVGCVLSHYDNDYNAPDLPPLLKEVMEIK